MTSVAGYRIVERLQATSRATIYRALREADGARVVLKVLQGEDRDPGRIARFRREFEVTCQVEGGGVVAAYELVDGPLEHAMALEDIGGDSLVRQLEHERLDVGAVLRIGVRLAEILGHVHGRGVVHKDVNPSNVVWNPRTDELRLIDFGIAMSLPRETAELKSPEVLEGTLAYMSPEQTGWMNRGVDYRTDFYSLGATLYHLAARRPPFTSAHPLGLIEAHVAQAPEPLDRVDPRVPRTFSAIVLRLLAKSPEDRYQSARALRSDLARSLDAHERQVDDPFLPGLHDVSDRFQVPEKLYGREAEIGALLEAFERVAGGATELVLVPGPAGVGKSSLVREVHGPIAARRGLFGSGKFDQFRRDAPYAALGQALASILRQILASSEPESESEDAEVSAWRDGILAALGPNAAVVAEVVPEVTRLLGELPEVPSLPLAEAQNRFHLTLRNFVGALASRGRPLVLALDDLQWADGASIELLQLLASDPELRSTLIVAAYRDGQVDESHPLRVALRAVEERGARVSVVTPHPLDRRSVTLLLADMLRAAPDHVEALATACLAMTGGNPFFLRELLRAVHDRGHLWFEPFEQRWRWDIEAIRGMDVAGDVVDLISGRMRRLEEPARRALRMAACLGSVFDLAKLACVAQGTGVETAKDLWPALEEGWIAPIGSAYRLAEHAEGFTAFYRFVHDRVRQAAYSLPAEETIGATHLDIARRLLERGGDATADAERLFEIANHVELGASLVTGEEERLRFAELDLAAGERAMAAVAHEPALRYFLAGIDLLGEDGWRRRYGLALALCSGAAEAAQLAGRSADMERVVERVLAEAHGLLDTVRAHEARIRAYIVSGRLVDGAGVGLALLARLGLAFPAKVRQTAVVRRILGVKLALARKSIEDLESLPAMRHPEKLAAMRVMMGISSGVYVAMPDLVPLVALAFVELTVRHGTAPESPYGYATYGLILCGFLNEHAAGWRFGRLAMRLVTRPESRKLRARTAFLVGTFVDHWTVPLRETLAGLEEGYRVGLDVGDVEYAFYAANFHVVHSYFAGRPLGEVAAEASAFAEGARRVRHEAAGRRLALSRQAIENLLGRSADPRRLEGSVCDGAELRALFETTQDQFALGALHVNEALLCSLFGDARGVLEHAAAAELSMRNMVGTIHVPVLHQHACIAELALLPSREPLGRVRAWGRVAWRLRQLRGWARHAPAAHRHRARMVEAEVARVLGHHARAVKAYEEAIALAAHEGYSNDQGLANELAAAYFAGRKNASRAETHLREARTAYGGWGALAKVRDIEARHPELWRASAPTPVSGVPRAVSGPRRDADDRSLTGPPSALAHTLDPGTPVVSVAPASFAPNATTTPPRQR